ncbi:MAG: type II secretion system F family protein [Candidatus Aenigmarchaeota archaeon]|nr:type II secretion system F family protein [Candidatus Aenigmarchaeota archaeon]
MIKLEMTKERKILLITSVISVILIMIGIISGDSGVLGSAIFISVFLVATPQLILNYIAFKEIREMEYVFPHFLRDLVEITRAGVPLHKGIIFTSKTNYGPLSKEIKKMANQLTWHVNIITVLEQFRKRMKRSKTLTKVIRVMIETYKSGGSVDNTLNSLSTTLATIQDTQKERKAMLNQYVIAMYAICFIFIGIIVAINRLMVPIFQSMGTQTGGIGSGPLANVVSNPCSVCIGRGGLGCGPCSIYSGICSIFGSETTSIACYYLALFFSMAVIQAITGGLVAGQIGEGSVRAGFKHSLIMLTVVIGAFFILVRLKFIGV